jgi:hypothetical protein
MGAVLLEVEVEKSVQEGMAALEELSWFRPDPALEGALYRCGTHRVPQQCDYELWALAWPMN